MRQGILIAVSAPSGGGKGSILSQVMTEDANVRYSVSATTRSPRPGERPGEHYDFVSRAQFKAMIAAGEMLEYAEYCGNYYGTPAKPVKEWLLQGYDVVLEIEVQGAAQIMEKAPECVTIFIMPPSMEVLEHRLRKRGTETEDAIKGRIRTAYDEIQHACDFQYIVINDQLEDAVCDMRAVLRAEKLKLSRNRESIEGVLGYAKTIG